MRADVVIDAGICGFRTQASAESADQQYVSLSIASDCEKIGTLADNLARHGPLDAYREISPAETSVLIGCAAETLTGCCAGCAVPVGLFKVMQVAAGLALPQDIHIRLHGGS